MEIVTDLLKILIPSSLVLVGMYLAIKNMVSKELEQAKLEIKSKNVEILLPLRLQATERLCLFLERMSLNNLILRVNEPGITAGHLHKKILDELRNEYNHNLSQQVYISTKSWMAVKKTVQDITTLVNKSAEGIDQNAKAIDLAKKIFDYALTLKEDPTTNAIKRIKGEVQQFF